MMQSKPTQAHGPYIVTTLLPCSPPEAGHEVSRRAVATLEEAREYAGDVIHELAPPEYRGDTLEDRSVFATSITASGLPETVLPDGTVIEVEPTNWYELNRAAGLSLEDTKGDGVGRYTDDDEAKIIAAFNAAQAEGATP